MTLTTACLYVIACFAVTITPGPTMLLAFANGTSRNWRITAMGIVGAALSDLILIGAVAVGRNVAPLARAKRQPDRCGAAGSAVEHAAVSDEDVVRLGESCGAEQEKDGEQRSQVGTSVKAWPGSINDWGVGLAPVVLQCRAAVCWNRFNVSLLMRQPDFG